MEHFDADDLELLNTLTACFDDADAETSALFGCDCERENCKRCNPPEEESAIIWDDVLSFEEKMVKLQVLRAAKRIKPKSFSKRITSADHIHARALGIKLD